MLASVGEDMPANGSWMSMISFGKMLICVSLAVQFSSERFSWIITRSQEGQLVEWVQRGRANGDEDVGTRR